MRKFAFLLSTLLPLSAHAGGVFVGEAGSQAMERGGAFVAKADDPTALSVNPAGLAKTRGVEAYVGANLLNYSLSFQRAGSYRQQPRQVVQPAYVNTPYPAVENEASFQPIPFIAVSGRVGDLAIGGGLYAPPSVPGRDFPCRVEDFCQLDERGAPAPQRYDVVSQSALIVYPSVAAAYRIHPRVDIGARFSWGIGHIQARNFPWAGVTPNDSEDPRADADFDAEVNDWFMPTFGAGLLVRQTDFLELGASYTYKTQLRGKGNGTARIGPDAVPGTPVFLVPDELALCAPGGTQAELKTCIDFDLPQMFALGARYIFRDGAGGERGDVELDVKWENWRDASDDTIVVDARDSFLGRRLYTTINRHGFQDVLAVRVGGSYRVDVGAHGLTLRAGFGYDTAAAPDSWTRVDKDGRARATFAGGAAYEIDRWRFDVGLAYVHEGSLTVTDDANPNPTFENRTQPDPLQPSIPPDRQAYHPYNAGTYDSGYLVGLVGVTARF
jgi:long-subunit fatty acid transport protein